MMNRLKELLPALTLSSILLALWEVGARIVDEMYILPSPSAIVMKIWKLKDILFTVHLPATLYVVLIGGYFYRTWGRASDVNECE